MEILQNSVSIRQNPELVLTAVNRAVTDALAVKSDRGEADAAAENILALIERA
jgi:hypothetical protein